MKIKSVYLLFVLLCFPLWLAQDDEDQLIQYCNQKSLLSGNTFTYIGNDWDRAYNDVASYATLRTENNENFCCYMKIKFENELYDEKYTQWGCIEVSFFNLGSLSDDDVFKAFLDEKETNISRASNVTVKNLDIDCSAKFINIFTLSLLLFLL